MILFINIIVYLPQKKFFLSKYSEPSKKDKTIERRYFACLSCKIALN
eukprot:UN15553